MMRLAALNAHILRVEPNTNCPIIFGQPVQFTSCAQRGSGRGAARQSAERAGRGGGSGGTERQRNCG